MPHNFAIHFIQRLRRNAQGTALVEFAIVFPFLFLLLFGGLELTRYIIIIQKVEKAASVMSSIVTQEQTAVAAHGTTPASGIDEVEITSNVFPNYNSVMDAFGCCTATPSEAVIITSLYKVPPISATNPVTPGNVGCNSGTEAACVRVQWQIGFTLPASSAGSNWVSAITGINASDNASMVKLCTNVDDPATGTLERRDCVAAAGVTGSIGTQPLTSDEQAYFSGASATTPPMIVGENMIVTEVFYQYEPFLQSLLSGVSSANGTSPFFIPPAPIVKRVVAMPRNGNLPDLPPDFPATQ